MNRCLATWIGLIAAGLAWAQAPFTIVRPADGSKVREKVRVLLPKDSIPDGGYVGVFVGGKFLEATVPQVQGKYREYLLDTKARGIPDGETTIELVLFVETNDQARVVDRSSVEVNVANSSSIPIPEEGVKLRYRWRPGMELVYNLEVRTQLATLTEAQNKLGARGADLPIEAERIRLLYAVDNAYPNGDGLVRIQAMPLQGKNYAWLTTSDETQPRRFMDYEMHSVYMRLTNTGMEVFGSVPFYVPLEGTMGEARRTDLFAVFPLPTLPAKPVAPGDIWQARFLDSALDLDKLYEQDRLTEALLARGEFLGVEWESGFPCAKIRHTLEAGQKRKRDEQNRQQRAGTGFASGASGSSSDIEDEKLSLEETVWFALDRGVVVKMVREETIDRKITSPAFGGAGTGPMGGPMGPMGGPQMGPMGPMGPGGMPPGYSGGPGFGPFGPPGMGRNQNTVDYRQVVGPAGNKGGGAQGGAVGGPAMGPGGMGGMFGGNRGMMGGGSAAQTRYFRIKRQFVFTLER
ncbi:MAG: hypothetical protein N2109_03915 [Fimbriimonadales bacterium]|nr:hypothetical protein [Fimbriimonadales bacterium]